MDTQSRHTARVLVGVILVVIIGLVWWQSWADETSTEEWARGQESGSDGTPLVDAAESFSEEQRLRLDRGSAGEATSKTAANPEFGRLLVRVVDAEDEVGVAGVFVMAWPRNGIEPTKTMRRGVTDGRGRLAIDAVPTGVHDVQIGRGREPKSVEVRRDEETIVEFSLAKGVRLRGKVVDVGGSPVPGAEIWLHAQRPQANDMFRTHRATQCDHEGKFELDRLTAAVFVGARAPFHAPSELFAIAELKARGTRELTLQLRGEAAQLEVSVVDGPRNVVGARVELSYGYRPVKLVAGWVSTADPGVELRTDKLGRCRAIDIAPGRIQVRALVPGFALAQRDVDLQAGARHEVRIGLQQGSGLHGRVRDEHGKPIEGAYLRIEGRRTRSSAKGEYRLDFLEARSTTLHFFAAGFDPEQHVVDLQPGQTTELDLVVEALPKFRGRVLSEDMQGLKAWRVQVREIDGNDARYGLSGADGTFEVGVKADRRYRIELREPGQWIPVPCPRLGVITSNSKPLDIVVSELERASAFVRLAVRDSAGKAVPSNFRVTDGEQTATPGVSMPAAEKLGTGAARLGPLPPNDYTLVIHSADGSFPTFKSKPFELAPRQNLDLGVVRVPDYGWVEYRFTSATKIDFATVTVEFQDPGGVMSYCLRHANATGTGRWPLFAGKYKAIVFAEGLSRQVRTIEVVAGQAVPLRSHLERGTRVVIHGTLPPNEERLSCTIRDNHGVCDEWDMRADAPYTRKRNVMLPVGWLTVEAVGKKGKIYRRRFEVTGESRQVISMDFSKSK